VAALVVLEGLERSTILPSLQIQERQREGLGVLLLMIIDKPLAEAA